MCTGAGVYSGRVQAVACSFAYAPQVKGLGRAEAGIGRRHHLADAS